MLPSIYFRFTHKMYLVFEQRLNRKKETEKEKKIIKKIYLTRTKMYDN